MSRFPSSDVAALTDYVLERLDAHETDGSTKGRRLIIGVVGIPASGKSTVAETLMSTINRRRAMTTSSSSSSSSSAPAPVCAVLPMDGFHLTRLELSRMDDPERAARLRGAPFTFDPSALATTLAAVARPGFLRVEVPGFDHAVKDPSPGAVVIEPHHKVVIVEGLYLLLDEGVWETDVGPLVDVRCLVECGEATAKSRIVPRHVAAGICKDANEAEQRWVANDRANGRYLLQHLDRDRLDVFVSECSGGAADTEKVNTTSSVTADAAADAAADAVDGDGGWQMTVSVFGERTVYGAVDIGLVALGTTAVGAAVCLAVMYWRRRRATV
jgi:pantothenate kinase